MHRGCDSLKKETIGGTLRAKTFSRDLPGPSRADSVLSSYFIEQAPLHAIYLLARRHCNRSTAGTKKAFG